MSAKIFKPAKTAMQSGKAKTGLWVLEFDQDVARKIDPVMGYTTSSDTRQQLRLNFETAEQAIGYAEKHGIDYRVIAPKEPVRKNVSYSDNFRFNRQQPWTH
ncbi:ETC complex I subunit [Ensifer soli]|uniref:ETC complex I subunit n=1 Tax=Ciceribacter sp. sgz301302 TaxID=3342379 RepID=UPI0035BAEA2A